MEKKLKINSLELKIRKLRDKIYIIPSTDNNWENCKQYWLQEDSINWLKKECKKIEEEKSLVK